MDNAEQQAQKLLPCLFSRCSELSNRHISICPASYRPVVAAALGAKDEIAKEMAGQIADMALQLAAKDAEIERLKKQVSIIDDESEHGQCVHAGTMGPLDCVFCISWAKRNAQLRSQLAVATPRVDGDGLWICLKPPSGREALICLSAKKYGPLVTEVIEETRQWIAQAERKG